VVRVSRQRAFPDRALIIADHRGHAFLLELPRPLCSLVTHPETYERDYLFRSLDLSFLSAYHFPLPNDDAEPNLGSSQPSGCWTRPRTPTTTRQLRPRPAALFAERAAAAAEILRPDDGRPRPGIAAELHVYQLPVLCRGNRRALMPARSSRCWSTVCSPPRP